LTEQIVSLEFVFLFDRIECGVDGMQLKDAVAQPMIPGGALDTDARKIDRGQFGLPRQRDRGLHQIVGVDVFLIGGDRKPLGVVSSTDILAALAYAEEER